MQNQNSVEYLEKIKIKIFENLRETTFVPSVEMQDIPRVSLGMDDEDDTMLDDADEDDNPDVRVTQRRLDETTEASGELSDSDDEDIDYLGLKETNATPGIRNEQNFKENGFVLSDVDDTGSHSPVHSPSPKANTTESDAEDIEMKDTAETTEPLDMDRVNSGSDNEGAYPSQASSKPSRETSNQVEAQDQEATEPFGSPKDNNDKAPDLQTAEDHLAPKEEETSSK